MSASFHPSQAAEVADRLLGPPSASERGGLIRRYGRKGSLKLDCRTGVFFDFEAGSGGGLVDLVANHLQIDRRAAWKWLEAGGAAVTRRSDDDRRAAIAAADVDDAKRIADAAAIWKASKPIAGTLAAMYLRARGLGEALHNGQLRFAPSQAVGDWRGPVMIARISNALTGEGQAVQLTPISALGRARDDEGKAIERRIRGKLRGGIIAFAKPDSRGRLGVSEGSETALSAALLNAWPTIAAVNAGEMARLPLIEGASRLAVFGDDDEAGRQAANALVERWQAEGRDADLRLPHGGDWNDELARQIKSLSKH